MPYPQLECLSDGLSVILSKGVSHQYLTHRVTSHVSNPLFAMAKEFSSEYFPQSIDDLNKLINSSLAKAIIRDFGSDWNNTHFFLLAVFFIRSIS